MIQVGFIGWRGMVGSVLLQRMQSESDLENKKITPIFFSTSQAGKPGPELGGSKSELADAYDLDSLSQMDIVVTCQGSGYTNEVYAALRKMGWAGYWLDAASALRMEKKSIIVLDPINRAVIDRGLIEGYKNYIGGNCTVSLMLMAIGGLFHQGLVEWLTSMTYQAASGAGAKNMKELVRQMAAIGQAAKQHLADPAADALLLDQDVREVLRSRHFPTDQFGVALAGSAIPWIDRPMESGQSREEYKGLVETNKILQTEKTIPVDGICVRIGAMRCHAQALTIKLVQDIPLKELEQIIASSNPWVNLVPNTKEATLNQLTPAAVSGSLNINVGRIRKLNMGPEYLTVFTVGDQLLWGAAEPIRRALNIIVDHLS